MDFNSRCELTRNLSFEILESPEPAAEKTLLKASKLTLLLKDPLSKELCLASASIELTEASGKKRKLSLNSHGLSIGRHPSNDCVVDDPYVSQFHLQIEAKDNEIHARDLGSANGIRKDKLSFTSCRLKDQEEIEFGQCKLKLILESQSLALSEKATNQFFGIVSQNKRMQKLFSLLEIASNYSSPVFLHGETGTGKELFAQALHKLSPRSEKEFLAINCAALPKDLVESELFGHEKGAFTSASNFREGALELANGGTLFLDEIGELDLNVQAKLLRCLETGEYNRVGSHQKRRTDIRIVTATHRMLEEMVEEGLFREDLYYRLHVIPFEIPPLRERLEDLDLLVPHLLNKLQLKAQISDEALAMLKLYEFPGNVRELKNILSRAAIELEMQQTYSQNSKDHQIRCEHLRFLPGLEKYRPIKSSEESDERAKILECLEKHEFHQSKAAKELGLAVSSLNDKIGRYAIKIPNKT